MNAGDGTAAEAVSSAGASEVVTVLLVDDQERFRDVARTVVARTPGMSLVGEAVDGLEAVQLVASLLPALVLMDIHMSQLDGMTATRRITQAHPDVVVVLLSSYDRDDLPAGAMECGAIAYLHKEELSPVTLAAVWKQRSGPDGRSLGT